MSFLSLFISQPPPPLPKSQNGSKSAQQSSSNPSSGDNGDGGDEGQTEEEEMETDPCLAGYKDLDEKAAFFLFEGDDYELVGKSCV